MTMPGHLTLPGWRGHLVPKGLPLKVFMFYIIFVQYILALKKLTKSKCNSINIILSLEQDIISIICISLMKCKFMKYNFFTVYPSLLLSYNFLRDLISFNRALFWNSKTAFLFSNRRTYSLCFSRLVFASIHAFSFLNIT